MSHMHIVDNTPPQTVLEGNRKGPDHEITPTTKTFDKLAHAVNKLYLSYMLIYCTLYIPSKV